MNALPPETGLGYTPPVVRQLSVFLENKVGRLHDMLDVFQREPGLELCAISVLEASEHCFHESMRAYAAFNHTPFLSCAQVCTIC